MSTPKDTLSRLLTLVQLILPYPWSVGTTLFERLQNPGYHASARAVQRDLERLTQTFHVVCDGDSKPCQGSLKSNLNLRYETFL
jgi:hypothetical protein